MTASKRFLRSLVAALAALIGIVLLLSAYAQSARADPGTLCVAPGGTGCDGPTCSGMCYESVQDAVDAAAPDDEILVAAGVYTGVQARGGMTQVVYISKTVAIRGGYSSDLTIRDLDLYATTLNAEGQGRVISIIGGGASTLDGLIITGGNADGVNVDCPAAGGQSDGCGGGVFAYGAPSIIVNNIISNNVAAISGASHSASGGGLCMAYGRGAVISGNLFLSNTASLGERGMGGGIHLNFTYDVSVIGNQILSNTATAHNSLAGWGGGIALGGSGATGTVQSNLIQGNRTNGGGSRYGAGIHQWSGSYHYTYNRVVGNFGGSAVRLGYGDGHFDSNQVVDNDTSPGIELMHGAGDGWTLVNNVVARSGSNTLEVSAHDGAPLQATLIHNTLVGSGAGNGVYVATGYVTLSLTNTIVVSHTWGITNTVPASSTVYADHTLFWANDQDGIRGTNPVDGDPAFADPAGGDYHLCGGSAAVDAGVEAGIDTDIDGDGRPLGAAPDIGADEARFVFLPLVLRS